MQGDVPERPLGQRFSHVYLRPQQLLQDSQRARRRVAALIDSLPDLAGVWEAVIGELGVDPIYGSVGVIWSQTLKHFSTQDFLDFFTVAVRFLAKKMRSSRGMRNPNASALFVSEVTRIFAEENLCYEIDARGGVHFKVDAEFAANTTAVITALGAPRYANAREQFESGMAALSKADIDAKQGIRGVFNAAECVFKLMYDRPRLAAGDVTKSLKPTMQRLCDADPTALKAANKSVEAFADWVDACHNYRHEQGVEEPLQPPLDLAVQLISVGSGFLRWLVNIDQQTRPATA
jgi:hypothetical protein